MSNVTFEPLLISNLFVTFELLLTYLHYNPTTHRDRFKLLKKRKGGDKLKKTVSAGGGVAAGESPLMQSCSLPPNVIHSVGGGGAGRSRDRDAAKGLTQSNLELGRHMDGISV